MAELKIGEISKPRFEFRTFGQQFDAQAERMARLSTPVPEKVWCRHSDEIYIVSRTNDVNNTKIRDGKMDIKTFVQAKDGLEQWDPKLKAEFPVTRQQLQEEIFPAFMVDAPLFSQDSYSYDEFIGLINAHADLQAVRIHKERYGYMVNNTICEVAKVLVNGAQITSINSESTELEDIQKTITAVGLEGVENINYLQAIKRVIGMNPAPLAN
ncbi:hypothetical protein [Ferrimonas lipolytica]|uniref:Uncharacterized protein n=1 Tax=Ferrimonas lipolytica TaxID=2724191 RepID=A0A6H1UEH1_9GAMM|nr:hypothetical protein [Ferrimonas lipolytica]QIZ77444.1 hypothetical protein HER31_11445 [Ferrimonas lipolytica]